MLLYGMEKWTIEHIIKILSKCGITEEYTKFLVLIEKIVPNIKITTKNNNTKTN